MEDQVGELMSKLIAMSKLTNDYDTMLKVISEAEGKLYGEPMLYVLKGWVHANQGDYDKAIGAYDNAIKLNPRAAWAHYRKGQALADQERYADAKRCLDAAVKLKPNKPEFWVEKAIVDDELNRLNESFEAYENAIRLGDKTGWGWAGKARILAFLNRLEESLDAIRAAMKLNPQEEGFRKLETHILDEMGSY
jgi:tetratricopeptide (TPR) repeat protein